MVDHGYMFDYYDQSRVTPWTMSYNGSQQRFYEGGTSSDASMKSVPYSALDSNSYQSLLSLRSSTIPPKDVASLRAFSTTVSSSVPYSLASQSSIGSTVPSTVSRHEPLLSAPLPIYRLQARRKRESEFFQAEYLPVELWHADRCHAAWAPPSDQPYYEVEWLRVARGRTPAALLADGVSFIDSTSDGSRSPAHSAAAAPTASAAPTWARIDEESSSDYSTTTTVMATDAIEEEWARNVHALSRELEDWSTTSSVVSPLSSDLSSIDLSTPTLTTACSIDAWDCETQNGEETDAPLPAKSSILRGVYDLLAAIFCSRRRGREEKIVKNVDVKMDRGYD